jgi:hypothetical protein
MVDVDGRTPLHIAAMFGNQVQFFGDKDTSRRKHT